MNLTTLRRIVLVGNVAAFAAAGAAAWHALDSRPAARDEKEWLKIFPVKAAPVTDPGTIGPGALPEYQAAAGWAQGDKPLPKKDDVAIEAPKVDPFRVKYRLNGVFVAEAPEDSCAQIGAQGMDRSFSIRVGEKIPEDPADARSLKRTPWRLDEVVASVVDPKTNKASPSTALFRHVETEEVQVLENTPGTAGDVFGKEPAGPGGSTPGMAEGQVGKPRRDQPSRFIQVRKDVEKGEVGWDVPDDEMGWLLEYGGDEASKIATVAHRDAAGNPDGFTLKAVPPGSRAAELGFKAEDRVVSVNGEKVHSTEQAVAVGKRQHEGGTDTFAVKILRAGKQINYTFRAKKKAKK